MITECVTFLHRFRMYTFITLAVIVGLSFFFLIKGNYSDDILDMLPVKDRIISQHLNFLSLHGYMKKIVFELSITDTTKTFDELKSTTREMIQHLRKTREFSFQGELTPGDFLHLRNLIVTHWPNLFEKSDSVWIYNRLNIDSLTERLDRTVSSLFTFSDASVDAFTVQNDPFGLALFSLSKLSAFKPADNIVIDDGFITNKNRTRILFIVEITGMRLDHKTTKSVHNTIQAIEKNIKSKGFGLTWMGAARASQDNSQTIRNDINLTLPITISLIFLICFFIYKRFYYGFLTFLPTFTGILITFAFFSYFGKMSVIIIGFGAALLGITVDYALHYLYLIDDIPKNTNPVKTLSGPILSSSFTTSGAFLVLITAKIPGLSQLGYITATGILLVAVLSILILPLMVKTSALKKPKKAIVNPAFWFKFFYTKKLDYPGAISCTILIIWACFSIPLLSFEGNPDSLNGMKPNTLAAEQRLRDNWPGIEDGMYLVVTDTSFKGVVEKAEMKLQSLIDTLVNKKYINHTVLFTHLYPSEKTQKINRKRWYRTFTADRISLMIGAANSVTKKYGFESSQFSSYFSKLAFIDSLDFLEMERFPISIKQGLIKNYVRSDGSLWYANVPVIQTTDTSWNTIEKLAKEKNILAINGAALGLRVVTIIKTGFFRCLLLIPIVIMCILCITLGNVKHAFLVLIPPFMATMLTLGCMSYFNIPVSIISLMIFAFIFGLGIDYTILMFYMSKKAQSEGQSYIYHGAASVTIAALTTLTGLGILVFASHPVLSSVGKTGLIGILSSYICAVVFVPLLVRLTWTNSSSK